MFSFQQKVRYSETDENLQLSITALINYFQDAATFDSNETCCNMKYLREHKLAWLLNSWQVEIERLPFFGENIMIKSFPYEFKGFMGLRNCLIEDEKGKQLVRANSIWTLTDMERLRIVKPSNEMVNAFSIGEKLDMNYKGRKIVFEGEGNSGDEIVIGQYQIDSNGHMNNAQYINVAMNYVPKNAKITEFRVEYKNAAYLGEVILPVVFEGDQMVGVQLRNAKNECIFANLEFTYVNE